MADPLLLMAAAAIGSIATVAGVGAIVKPKLPASHPGSKGPVAPAPIFIPTNDGVIKMIGPVITKAIPSPYRPEDAKKIAAIVHDMLLWGDDGEFHAKVTPTRDEMVAEADRLSRATFVDPALHCVAVLYNLVIPSFTNGALNRYLEPLFFPPVYSINGDVIGKDNGTRAAAVLTWALGLILSPSLMKIGADGEALNFVWSPNESGNECMQWPKMATTTIGEATCATLAPYNLPAKPTPEQIVHLCSYWIVLSQQKNAPSSAGDVNMKISQIESSGSDSDKAVKMTEYMCHFLLEGHEWVIVSETDPASIFEIFFHAFAIIWSSALAEFGGAFLEAGDIASSVAQSVAKALQLTAQQTKSVVGIVDAAVTMSLASAVITVLKVAYGDQFHDPDEDKKFDAAQAGLKLHTSELKGEAEGLYSPYASLLPKV